MKKFNVKVLSMAVTAAVASGAAGAAEQNFAAAVGGKDDQGQAAFFTVFGEGTTYDKDTGKLTFKKDSDALLLKTLELEQTINGFASGSDFITTDANGNKTVRKATNEDIEADSLKGVGLAGGLDNLAKETAAALDDQNETIEELKTAITTNGTRIAEVATGVNKLNESVAEISTKFDEVDSEISKASSELSESIEKVSEDVTAVNTRVDSLAQDTADAKAAAKAAEDKVTELSANVDSKVKEAKDAADKAVDAASKIDAVADKADKASKGVVGLTKALEAAAEQAALASAENAQALNGFVEGDEIVVTDKNGIKSIKTATQEDVENADFEGMGLKEVVTAHDETLDDLTKAVTENNEALVKTAEVVNAISADVNANKAALEEQEKANEGFNNAIASLDEDISTLKKVGLAAAEALEVNRQDIDANKAAIETKADKADFEELAKYTADMGKNVNDIGDEVTALSDATSAAITRHDKDIVDLAQAGLKATEALEANRKDIDANKQGIVDLAKGLQLAAEAVEDNRKEIDANKAAIAENTAKLEEQKEANDGFNNAIASLDEDIITLKKADLAAADALKAHRTDIDANKAAIETKADKTAVESVRTIAVEAQKSAQVAKGAVEVAQKSAETADSHAKAAQTAAAKAQESADTNAVQIAANTKQIDTNKTDIAALQTANGQHAAGIAKNSARIDSLDKNVANLRKETRQGLAAQAALSGLFQPYSVGKFNVTAALGGFKSDTAVAVGAGYRFNENFAAKAGLAVGTSSGGSASYNVGLNYEW